MLPHLGQGPSAAKGRCLLCSSVKSSTQHAVGMNGLEGSPSQLTLGVGVTTARRLI